MWPLTVLLVLLALISLAAHLWSSSRVPLWPSVLFAILVELVMLVPAR